MLVRRILVVVAALALFVSSAAHAQFAAGLQTASTSFQDPDGRFTLTLPSGWSYQPDKSEPSFLVFFGPGSHDLFFVEVLDVSHTGATPVDLAHDAVALYSGPNGLEGFEIVAAPAPGQLGGKDAAFMVYSYDDGAGTAVIEGRAMTIYQDKVFTLAFADRADLFEASTATFNAVMSSFTLHETASIPQSGISFGSLALSPGSHGETADTTHPPTSSTSYTSPDGHYSFLPPEGWELWEEQSTRRGDQIEPWHTLFEWSGRPMSKSLFIWDYFDEWEQVGAQYEIVFAVIDNVPGALSQSIDTLVRQITGANATIYTASNSRVRIGDQNGMAVKIVARPGMVEPWSLGVPWFRQHTFYVLKQGVTLFVWAFPNEIVDLPEVTSALESFRWVAH